MIERHPILVTILMIALIVLGSCIGTRVGAQALLVPSTSYVVENVGTVTVWIDERFGQLCTQVGPWYAPAVSCVALKDTSFGRQIGP